MYPVAFTSVRTVRAHEFVAPAAVPIESYAALPSKVAEAPQDSELTVPQPSASPEPTTSAQPAEPVAPVDTPAAEAPTPEAVPSTTTVAASIPSTPENPAQAGTDGTSILNSLMLPLGQYTISQGYSRAHTGIDMASELGTPIRSVAAGCLTISYGYNGGYGNMVEQDLGSGYSARYAHLSRFDVSVSNGICVNQGDIIGYVGSTGRSTGPHLHFELQRYGAFLRPIFSN